MTWALLLIQRSWMWFIPWYTLIQKYRRSTCDWKYQIHLKIELSPRVSQVVKSTKEFLGTSSVCCGSLILDANYHCFFPTNPEKKPNDSGCSIWLSFIISTPLYTFYSFLSPKILSRLMLVLLSLLFHADNCHRFSSVLDQPPFLGEPNVPLALDSIWVGLTGPQDIRVGRGYKATYVFSSTPN